MGDTKIKAFTGDFVEINEAGEFEAVIATFDIPDKEGEILRSSVIGDDPVDIKISAWSHNHYVPNVGVGQLNKRGNNLVCRGKLFLNTEGGQEHYTTIKENGPLQEWSYGIRNTSIEFQTIDSITYPAITDGEFFEVSPCFVGVSPGNHTVTIKSEKEQTMGDENKEGADVQKLQSDVDSLTTLMTEGFSKLGTAVEEGVTKTKAEIGGLKTELESVKTDVSTLKQGGTKTKAEEENDSQESEEEETEEGSESENGGTKTKADGVDPARKVHQNPAALHGAGGSGSSITEGGDSDDGMIPSKEFMQSVRVANYKALMGALKMSGNPYIPDVWGKETASVAIKALGANTNGALVSSDLAVPFAEPRAAQYTIFQAEQFFIEAQKYSNVLAQTERVFFTESRYQQDTFKGLNKRILRGGGAIKESERLAAAERAKAVTGSIKIIPDLFYGEIPIGDQWLKNNVMRENFMDLLNDFIADELSYEFELGVIAGDAAGSSNAIEDVMDGWFELHEDRGGKTIAVSHDENPVGIFQKAYGALDPKYKRRAQDLVFIAPHVLIDNYNNQRGARATEASMTILANGESAPTFNGVPLVATSVIEPYQSSSNNVTDFMFGRRDYLIHGYQTSSLDVEVTREPREHQSSIIITANVGIDIADPQGVVRVTGANADVQVFENSNG